jgi:hypothetical protein
MAAGGPTRRVHSGESSAEDWQEPAAHGDGGAAYATPMTRILQPVYLIFGILQVLLLVRFVLKLLSANSANAIVAGLYAISEPLVRPFYGIFPQPDPLIEVPALLAIVFLVLVEALIVAVVGAIARR